MGAQPSNCPSGCCVHSSVSLQDSHIAVFLPPVVCRHHFLNQIGIGKRTNNFFILFFFFFSFLILLELLHPCVPVGAWWMSPVLHCSLPLTAPGSDAAPHPPAGSRGGLRMGTGYIKAPTTAHKPPLFQPPPDPQPWLLRSCEYASFSLFHRKTNRSDCSQNSLPGWLWHGHRSLSFSIHLWQQMTFGNSLLARMGLSALAVCFLCSWSCFHCRAGVRSVSSLAGTPVCYFYIFSGLPRAITGIISSTSIFSTEY